MGLRVTLEAAEDSIRMGHFLAALYSINVVYEVLAAVNMKAEGQTLDGVRPTVQSEHPLRIPHISSDSPINVDLFGDEGALKGLRTFLEGLRDWNQKKEQEREKTKQERERTKHEREHTKQARQKTKQEAKKSKAMDLEIAERAVALVERTAKLSPEERRLAYRLLGESAARIREADVTVSPE